ncbi:GcrA family cell cycle regulator [Halovulum sp. GXIMD14793]
MSWTDERVETLKTMWNEGKSASQIAKELGGVTRNAVIGKVHRLGLSNRTTAAKAPAKEPAKAKPAPKAKAKPAKPAAAKTKAEAKPAPKAEAPEPEVKQPVRAKPPIVAGQPLPPQPSNSEISPETLKSMEELEKKAKKLTLMQLTERTCKWPIGDPATEDFWFCGHPSVPGKPYCETHVQVAFQPMSSRRDRRSSSR